MLIVIAIMTLGMILGYFFRKSTKIKGNTEKFTKYVIFLLLFVMGISIGSDKGIMKSLPTLGLQSLIITIGALAGSVLLAWLAYIVFFKNDKK
ncbi:MAG: LysO family transporter [Salinivirgaceae bacterium]|nr:LysO family transporter [Salinivirgaceae bacterium]MDD4747087.1 LysO family transporter [Salinivirgaceae bacterium]MDY0280511.1 LysO family transporter [Salinivirgaceae bacterium]